MRIKNDRGVSLITLGVAIIILVVITSVLVYSAKDGTRIKNLEALNNDIMSLTDKVNNYYLENGDIPLGIEYKNDDFMEALKASGQQNLNDGNSYYVLDLSKLDNVSLNYGRDYDRVSSVANIADLDDVYIINQVSHTIYYPKSIQVENVKYYTIQESWAKIDLRIIPIYTAQQLAKIGSGETIAVEEAGGEEYTFSLDGTYLLKNDLDLSSVCYKVDGTTTNDKSWTPIGTSTNPFTGTLYGNGYEISNLYINSTADYQGLFGYASGSTIQDLGIASGSITTTGISVGSIAGYQTNYAIIENCYNNINITAKRAVGGIAGHNYEYSKIYYCYNTGDISTVLTNDRSASCGGITANNVTSEIKYCYNTGKISSQSNCCGGIVGSNYMLIEACYNTGNVSSSLDASNGIGGVVGFQNADAAIIKDCYNVGNVLGQSNIGGICGNTEKGKIENCYNISENISKSTSGAAVGTIFGGGSPIVTNCYSIESDTPLYTNLGTGTIDSLTSQKKEEEMRSTDFITVLNAGRTGQDAIWAQDTKNINNGYPILAWQNK